MRGRLCPGQERPISPEQGHEVWPGRRTSGPAPPKSRCPQSHPMRLTTEAICAGQDVGGKPTPARRPLPWSRPQGSPGQEGLSALHALSWAPSPEAGPAPLGLCLPAQRRGIQCWAAPHTPQFQRPPDLLGVGGEPQGPPKPKWIGVFRAKGWMSGCQGLPSMFSSVPVGPTSSYLSGDQETPRACPGAGADLGSGQGGRQVRGALEGLPSQEVNRVGVLAEGLHKGGLWAMPDPEGAGGHGTWLWTASSLLGLAFWSRGAGRGVLWGAGLRSGWSTDQAFVPVGLPGLDRQQGPVVSRATRLPVQ